jgi:undecaprenyl-diphosphatase
LAVLTIIQGITEFLPISSSGHLILVPVVTGWADQGLFLDVAVHVGTLAAVMVYFWRDLWRIAVGFLGGRQRRKEGRAGRRLGYFLVVSTIPALGAGGAIALLAPDLFRDPVIIGWTMLIFGIVLYVADRVGMTIRRVEHMTMRHAIALGFAQVLALIPGTSRSGITMTAARTMGYERGEAARFSMLMSIPLIAALGVVAGLDVAQRGDAVVAADAAAAVLLSFATALIAIAALLALLRRVSFTPFVIYRVLLGGGLLGWFYFA